jgi:hypothetical protein
MIIYNKTSLTNLLIVNDAKQANQQGLLGAAELVSIEKAYEVNFYMPGVFVRAGLFILTVIICILSCGLLSLLFSGSRVITSFGWLLFLGLACYITLEIMVKDKKYFHSGVDEALLYMAGALIAGGIVGGFDDLHADAYHFSYIVSSLSILMLSIYLTLRFADVVTSVTAFASLFACLFFVWSNMGAIGEATLPFATMALASIIYIVVDKIDSRANLVNYRTCLDVIKVLSLLTLYAAGNYFTVQKVSNILHNAAYEQNTSIPFGILFWIWTIALPFVYIGFGIRKKNVLLLRTGLLLITAAVFTFRNYYHLLPIETMLALGGIVIIAIAYSVHRYLKTPKHGFTTKSLNEKNFLDQIKVESLIVAGTLSEQPTTPSEPGFQFGGGSAGGGGSSGNY